MQSLLLVLLALLMGCASAIQGATNGTLAGRTGLPTAIFVSSLSLFLVATAVWLWSPRPFATSPASPWYLYVGGFYGLFVIAGAAFAFPRLGAGPTTALMVAAQLCTALWLDHAGLPSGKVAVTPVRLVGAAFLVVGAVLVLWPKLFPRT